LTFALRVFEIPIPCWNEKPSPIPIRAENPRMCESGVERESVVASAADPDVISAPAKM
jgi:hypothetical protein